MVRHPVQLVVADDLRRSRLTVFFRLLLAIPHLVWVSLWSFGLLLVGPIAWVAALIKGRVPTGLHEFLVMYVRYVTHVWAYLTLAANPFPGFTGQPGYPIDVELPEPVRQSRWTIAFRLPLALPALLVAGAVGTAGGGNVSGGGGVSAVTAVLGWFASLARGRMPSGLRDLASYGIGYTAQAYAYVLLVTPRYPHASPEAVRADQELPQHPVRLVLADDGRRSRLTTLFRLLLALPHLVWLTLWALFATAAALLNWFVTLVLGQPATPLHRFLAAYVRYGTHVGAFLFLVGNPFPGFVGARGYPVDVELPPPARQRRWVTLLRTLLVVPALLVAGALGGALFVTGFLGWFVALVRGRMPSGLRDLGAVALRYLAQTNAYWLVVTDRYPYAGPAVRPPPPAEDVERDEPEETP
jgi:uncharacterized membrane protein